MDEERIARTTYRATDFVTWQRQGALELSPIFQRRTVWKKPAKSYFIDTMLRDLPSPIILIRERVDLDSQETIREVVDGQQRLRTLISFVNPESLDDFSETRDRFTVQAVHNEEAAGKDFQQLAQLQQRMILSYEFSTHILPIGIEDREVLRMFARLNATGLKLDPQELRNAKYFGVFKTLMYDLALEQLDRWRSWKILTDRQISRMKEVETTSDLVMNIVKGLTGKTQARLDDLYAEFDDSFPDAVEVGRRFRRVMDEIEKLLADQVSGTAYSSEVYFFTLFMYLYDILYGAGSPLTKQRTRSTPPELPDRLLIASKRFQGKNVPAKILDAFQRASADLGRRQTRLDYMHELCDVPASH